MMRDGQNRQEAARNFEKARQKAKVTEISNRIVGKSDRLLPFDAVRSALQAQNPMLRGLQQIPLAKIVGSVGRYNDFTRSFVPLNDAMRERWINVESLAATQGWPPIEVYQVGPLYFVRDGNHRVAIAKQLGVRTIEARVWEFPEDITIDDAAELDELLIKLGERKFLEQTRLNEHAPDHGIHFSAPGRYSELIVQIEAMRESLSRIDGQPVSFEAAVPAWYELVYLPTIQIIRESTLLDDFPGRSESDLFAWLSLHRTQLADHYGDYENLADLASTLAERYREQGLGKVMRQVRNLLGAAELPPLPALTTPLPESTNEAG